MKKIVFHYPSSGISAIRTYKLGDPVPVDVVYVKNGQRVPIMQSDVLIADHTAGRGTQPTR